MNKQLKISLLGTEYLLPKFEKFGKNSGLEIDCKPGNVEVENSYNSADVILINKEVWDNWFGLIFATKSQNSMIILVTNAEEFKQINAVDYDIFFDIWPTDDENVLDYRIFYFLKRMYNTYSTDFTTVLNNLPFPVVTVDDNYNFINANDYFYITFDVQVEDTNNFNIGMFTENLFGEDICSKDNKTFSIEKKAQFSDTFYAINKSSIYDAFQNLTGYFFVFRDITVRKKNEAKLRSLSEIDELTKINNKKAIRVYFDVNYKGVLDSKSSLTVFMMDLDCFKQYNDFYGHLEGDKVLMAMGEILSQFNNDDDIVTARFGGEEFVLLCKGNCYEEVVAIAESIQQMVRERKIPHEKSKVTDTVTLSMGVAYYDHLDENMIIPQIMENADKALYEAKNTGRNKYVIKRFPENN